MIAGLAGALYAHQTTYVDSTTFNVMMSVEILTFVVVGGGSTFWGPALGAVVLTLLPEFLRTLREWLELMPVSWTDFYPMNRVYDFLHDFLDFENAKRLIAYGIMLIVMMIVRPDGLLTRDGLRGCRPRAGGPKVAETSQHLPFDRRADQALRRLLRAERRQHERRATATSTP